MKRLPRLGIARPRLYLRETVRAEPARWRHELRVGALDAVGIGICVVGEGAPHDDGAVGSQRVGQDVRAVGVSAAVVLRAGLSLAVRLHDETTEVRNQAIDLVSRGT